LGTVLLARMALSCPDLNRRSTVLLAAVLAPWIGDGLHLSGLIPIDPVPAALSVAGVALALSLFRTRWLGLVPEARAAVVDWLDDGVCVLDRHDRVAEVNPAFQRITGYSLPETLGRPAAELLSPWVDFYACQRPGGSGRASFAVGGTHYELRIMPLRGPSGQLTGRVVMVRDVTERQRAASELRARWQGAETLRQTMAVLAESLGLDETLGHILDQLERVVAYDSASVQLLQDNRLEVVAARGFPDLDAVVGLRLPMPGHDPYTSVIADRTPLIVAHAQEAYPIFGQRSHRHIRSWLGVPLIVRDRVIGMLAVGSVEPAAYNQEHIQALMPFAGQVAVFIENARLFEEMERLKEFNESIVHGVAEAILIADAEGRLTFLNRAAEELLGYQQDELIGLDWRVIVPDEELARIRLERVDWQEWKESPRETALKTKDGRIVPVIISARLLFDEGEFSGVLAAFTNITGRKRIEEALQQRNRELAMLNRAGRVLSSTLDLDQVLVTLLEEVRHLMNVVASSIWLVDRETGELVCRQVTGPRSDIVHGWRLPPGQGIVGWVVTHGEGLFVADTRTDRRHFRGVDSKTGLETRSALCVPLRIKEDVIGALEVVDTEAGRFDEKDLALLDLLASSAAIAIENARLYEVAQQEIAERRRVEAALRESEERHRTLVENIPIGMYRSTPGPRGAFLMANPAFLSIFGFSSEDELKQLDMADLYVHPVERKIFSDRLLAQGSIAGIELQLQRKDGTPIWGSITAKVIYDEMTGRPAYFDCTIENITARKQVEAERERLIEELDAFDHTVAHDLKNPLSLVVGLAETIVRDYAVMSKEDLQKYLRRIAQAGRKAGSIIDELLVLAGVRKRAAVEMKPLDTGRIVSESLERLGHLIERRQAIIELPETWPMAMGYPPWVEEVWVNYISNAVKYGGRPPRLELGAKVQPDGQVRFWVRDHGPGIAPDEQSRLFTRFTQLGHVHAEGHGLGLSIVQRIVEKLGGQVGVESTVGEGSLFFFTLPSVPGDVT
jgi:PAS domain S-box-containing protein